MKFAESHAKDVAVPSACLLAGQFFPNVKGQARDRLIHRLTEFLMTTLLAFAEFHPVSARPEPSPN